MKAMLLALSVVLWSASTLAAQRVYHTVDDALRRAFDGGVAERTAAVLSETERARVVELAAAGEPGSMLFPYVVRRDGVFVGTVYFDTHRVRSLRETLMIAVAPDGTIRSVLLCAFGEPIEYAPRAAFYEQFHGRRLDDELRLQRGIDGVSGATLSARATTECARRVLAVHRVLAARAEPAPGPTPPPIPPERRGGERAVPIRPEESS